MVAQVPYLLTDSVSAQIKNYELLPDKGYTIHQILSDTTFRFISNDSLRPGKETAYWLRLKIENPFFYDQHFDLWLRPYFKNTLYYFDSNDRKWVARETGIKSRSDYRKRGVLTMPFILQGQTTNVLYVKTDLPPSGKYAPAFKPKIVLKQQKASIQEERIVWIAWVASLVVLLLFFLNNLYVYFSFRDRTILYYLIAQLGGIIYITSYREFFTGFFNGPVFTFQLKPNGFIAYFNLNFLLMYISLILIMYGIVQFTRSYLETPKNLPVHDKVLKYGLIFYLAVTGTITLLNVSVICLLGVSTVYENILALLLICAVLFASVSGYRRRLRTAGPFLVANTVPLVFIICTTLFHVFVSHSRTDETFLPDLSIVAQAFGFSVALVARTRLLQNDLNQKKLEANQLEFDLREITLQQRFMKLENEKINAEINEEKIRNELLNQTLEVNQRELASTTLYIVQKNKMLAKLKKQIHDSNADNKNENIKDIESLLNSNLYLDSDWSKFKLHFEQVHPNFFSDLIARYPSLTKNEIRLFAYFHINLSTKEIAALLNVDPGSVRRAKSRLYKKIAILGADETQRKMN
ncbi:hypothetical protein DYBT9275_02899 [Dyadobacter sp. CECT 9275]|uniref:7TM-DISM receptor extracellular domain-containing protein n=1 Tax=Dyadobacter helix TaxID=2822344 RepID=A0A916N4V2_9BACT|nr:hypothetical protein DYBT9275_02899 [Dyadobacter sp. CECT 9275]